MPEITDDELLGIVYPHAMAAQEYAAAVPDFDAFEAEY